MKRFIEDNALLIIAALVTLANALSIMRLL